MKKCTSIFLVILVIISTLNCAFLLLSLSSYNKLLRLDEEIKLQYSQIQVNLQRRMDLIPNYLKVVEFEVDSNTVPAISFS